MKDSKRRREVGALMVRKRRQTQWIVKEGIVIGTNRVDMSRRESRVRIEEEEGQQKHQMMGEGKQLLSGNSETEAGGKGEPMAVGDEEG